MVVAELSRCHRTFADEMRHHCRNGSARLHWVVMNSLGIQRDDVIHSSVELAVFEAVARSVGVNWVRRPADATVTIVYDHPEAPLMTLVTRLSEGRRIVAYNHERQLDALSMRSFDLATACLFDQQSAKIVRIFDGAPKRVEAYVHVELADHSDSALSMHASRIAALR